MKKILLLAVCASILLALCSCQSQTTNLDISKKNNIYDDMAEYIANPTQYEGKTITLSA